VDTTTGHARLLLPITDVCLALGKSSRTTVYKLVDERHLDLVKIGRRSFVTAESLERYVAQLTTPAEAKTG
jgi:excisionase family DNA binding protein